MGVKSRLKKRWASVKRLAKENKSDVLAVVVLSLLAERFFGVIDLVTGLF